MDRLLVSIYSNPKETVLFSLRYKTLRMLIDEGLSPDDFVDKVELGSPNYEIARVSDHA